MGLPAGYDKWRLQGPLESGAPTCDWCGDESEIRVITENCPLIEPLKICAGCYAECYPQEYDDPSFNDLQFAQDYFIEQADLRADYEHDRRRDDRRNP